jgi:hypothetical protein
LGKEMALSGGRGRIADFRLQIRFEARVENFQSAIFESEMITCNLSAV